MTSRTALAALLLLSSAGPDSWADDLWLDMTGNGVPGTTVFDLDGTPNRPYAIVLAGSLQEQTLLGVQVHVDLSWLFATTAVPGFVGILDPAGYATVSVPVPNLSALLGVPFFAQAFLFNPLDSWSNWCGVLFEPSPGTGPGSGVPAFQHRQGGILHGVHFLDPQDGWTAEDGGRIRVTHDGGATWGFQRTPDDVRSPLRGIFFLDADRGWAVGDDGVVLRTTNGGCLWSRATSVPTAFELFQVRFVSPTQGWAVGKWGNLLASVDGGETWTSQAPACLGTEDLYGLAFTGPTTGFAAGDEGIVLRTTDAGQTWVSVANPFNPTGSCPQPGVDLEWWTISFANPALGWISGGEGTGDGEALVTTDGGQTWTATAFCAPPGPATLYGIAALG
ncbi:MAG: WD40/YVTN/BNR-like repeat-containing protein, partial [Planctomycetota bacterium]